MKILDTVIKDYKELPKGSKGDVIECFNERFNFRGQSGFRKRIRDKSFTNEHVDFLSKNIHRFKIAK